MFGLTPAHLFFVLVIALVVVGPGKLPDVGRALGESVKEFRRATSRDPERDEGASNDAQ